MKFFCKLCDNSWIFMVGRIIFWFKKIEESERKEEMKIIIEVVKEDGEDFIGVLVKDMKNFLVCMYWYI